MDAPLVGSLVVPSPKYRASMGTGEGAAVLLAVRRGSARLFYPGPDRSYWVPTNDIRSIPAEAVGDDSIERFLSDLLLFLSAEECDVEAFEGGTMELSVEAPSLSRAELSTLESRWRGRLETVGFEPRNMSRITIQLRLVYLPGSAATGT